MTKIDSDSATWRIRALRYDNKSDIYAQRALDHGFVVLKQPIRMLSALEICLSAL